MTGVDFFPLAFARTLSTADLERELSELVKAPA
jgi:hypothetical protein